MSSIRNYTELSQLQTFRERFEYLKSYAKVGDRTFGANRYINQSFYRSRRWREVRDEVIIRDGACDLGIEGREILDMIIVHHIDPISEKDIQNNHPKLYDLENLICVTDRTHKAIHYGGDVNSQLIVERFPNDTVPWKS